MNRKKEYKKFIKKWLDRSKKFRKKNCPAAIETETTYSLNLDSMLDERRGFKHDICRLFFSEDCRCFTKCPCHIYKHKKVVKIAGKILEALS